MKPRSLLPIIFLAFSFFLSPSGAAFTQHAGVDYTELEKVILDELRQTLTPGATVAIVNGDRVVFAKGFGVANIETRQPVTTEMLFRNGSAGKMLTAAVVVSLAEEGKLDLQAPIGKYVKGLNPKLSQLTPHQLMAHLAGLIDISAFSGLSDEPALASTVRSWTDEMCLFEPGKIFSYSNSGYSLLGLLIEEVTRQSYSRAMTERLFKPLGMNRTMFEPTMAITYPLSQGHAGDPENLTVFRPQYDSAAFRPSGYEYSNVLDLARFAIAILNNGQIDGRQAIPRAVIAKISAPYVPIHSSPNSYSIVDGKYGYGLISHNFRGVNVVEHGGVIPGYGCRLVTVPEQRFAVIVMTNQTGVTLNNSIEKAMELMLPLKPKQVDRSKDWALITESEMSRYVGVYENNDSRLEIVVKNGRLMFVVSGRELPMTRIGEHRFSIPRRSVNELTFVIGADGKAEYRHTGLRAWQRVGMKK